MKISEEEWNYLIDTIPGPEDLGVLGGKFMFCKTPPFKNMGFTYHDYIKNGVHSNYAGFKNEEFVEAVEYREKMNLIKQSSEL